MGKGLNTAFLFVLLVIIFVGSGAFYTVDETQQAVITQFGEPIGNSITEPGLKFKYPFIQKANYFDKRILPWDGDPNEIQTREKRLIWIDTIARWRINDALKFMQSLGIESRAQARLDDIIDGATRDVVANHNQVEIIRNSNRLYEKKDQVVTDEDVDFELDRTAIDPIQFGREELSRKILEQARPLVSDLGIELVDIRIKRLNYIESVREKVYDRMISERNAAAAQYRSEGQGKRAEIEGDMKKELAAIEAEAYRTSETIRGKADAEAIKIYAEAYNQDPEFYSFTKTLESYRKTINNATTLIFTTDNEFYQQLKGAQPDI